MWRSPQIHKKKKKSAKSNVSRSSDFSTSETVPGTVFSPRRDRRENNTVFTGQWNQLRARTKTELTVLGHMKVPEFRVTNPQQQYQELQS